MTPLELTSQLGIDHPIVQAPLGGVPTNALVAAVSAAGGLGSLGAAYLSPQAIGEAVQEIRSRTDRPFAVNLFAGGYDPRVGADAARMLAILGDVHARLGLPPPEVPVLPPDPFPAQLEVVLEARPAVFSFTFGIPDARSLGRLRAAGIRSWGTATTVREGRLLAAAGVDGIVAQGTEAGGHRGTFAEPVAAGLVPTLELVRRMGREVALPIVAAGGIMDGRDVAAVIRAGAAAAALGTAFLVCPECGTSEPYRKAILAARGDPTVLTRAFSGRTARGLRNGFIERVHADEGAILPFPLQNALTRPMRMAAAKRGEPDFLSLWAGTGVARARVMPAAELVATLVDELQPPGTG